MTRHSQWECLLRHLADDFRSFSGFHTSLSFLFPSSLSIVFHYDPRHVYLYDLILLILVSLKTIYFVCQYILCVWGHVCGFVCGTRVVWPCPCTCGGPRLMSGVFCHSVPCLSLSLSWNLKPASSTGSLATELLGSARPCDPPQQEG